MARKETVKGIKGDMGKFLAIVSDFNKEELVKMGYNGVSLNINDIDEVLNFVKSI